MDEKSADPVKSIDPIKNDSFNSMTLGSVHSVTLDRDACHGCITCVKRCPTEAIRVRNGKAQILTERCIDCGECIRVCPHHAKRAVTGSIDEMNRYEYKIALPPPSFYGQFRNLDEIETVLGALTAIGFDEVFEVSKAAELVSDATRKMLKESNLLRPVISSACPAILRLIRVRFPQFLKNVLPINAPVEIAARMAKNSAALRTGLPRDKIGTVFLTPCPAKVSAAKVPLGTQKSEIDLLVSVSEVYPLLLSSMKDHIGAKEAVLSSGRIGLGWGRSGGEASATLKERYLAADGIENVIRILEHLEDEKISYVDFIELNACSAGCVGGVLNVENPYVAVARLKRLRESQPISCNNLTDDIPGDMLWDQAVEPSDVMRLGDNSAEAFEQMRSLEEIQSRLYGLDCGSCGSPSCEALAEDIVRGLAKEDSCIYVLKEKVETVMRDIMSLSLENPQRNRTDESLL